MCNVCVKYSGSTYCSVSVYYSIKGQWVLGLCTRTMNTLIGNQSGNIVLHISDMLPMLAVREKQFNLHL